MDILFYFIHAIFETFDTLTQSLHQFRNLLTTEKKQNDKGDYKNLPCSQISNQKQIVHIFTNLI